MCLDSWAVSRGSTQALLYYSYSIYFTIWDRKVWIEFLRGALIDFSRIAWRSDSAHLRAPYLNNALYCAMHLLILASKTSVSAVFPAFFSVLNESLPAWNCVKYITCWSVLWNSTIYINYQTASESTNTSLYSVYIHGVLLRVTFATKLG